MTLRRRIVALLRTRDATDDDIVIALKSNHHSTRNALGDLRQCFKAIHICHYATDELGRVRPVYRLGAKKDAAKPLSRTALARKMRKEERADNRRNQVSRHAIEVAMYGGPESVAVRIPPVPVEAWEAA